MLAVKRHKRSVSGLTAFLLGFAAVSSVALADPLEHDRASLLLPDTRVWLEVATFSGTQPVLVPGSIGGPESVTYVSPAIRMQALLAERWLVRAALPVLTQTSEVGFVSNLGNLTVDGSYLLRLSPRVWLASGLGLALPTMFDDRAAYRSREPTLSLTRAMRGYADPWEFRQRRLTLYFPFAIELGSERLRLAAEAALGLSIGISPEDRNVISMIVGARAQMLVLPWLSIGARLKMASLASEDQDSLTPLPADFRHPELDRLQCSLEPFAELYVGRFLGGLGVLVNLDEPYGFGSAVHVWAARLTLGMRF